MNFPGIDRLISDETIRCAQLQTSIRDLDLLTIGMVNDMFAESRNDEYKGYHELATHSDMDVF